MADQQRHIIERLRAEINLPGSRKEADHLSRQLTAVLQETLLPGLEEVFNQVAPTDTYLRLDELDVNLDWDRQKLNLEELVPRLTTAISKRLAEKREEMQAENPQNYSKAGHLLETLAYIINHGHYPWWWENGNWQQLESGLEELIGQQAGLIRRALPGFHLDRERNRQRFLRQLSPELQDKLLEAYWGKSELDSARQGLEELGVQLLRIFPAFRDHKGESLRHYLLARVGAGLTGDDNFLLRASAWAFWDAQYQLRSKDTHWISRLDSLVKQGQLTSKEAELLREKDQTDKENRNRLANYMNNFQLTRQEQKMLKDWLRGANVLGTDLKNKLVRQLNEIKGVDPDLLKYLQAQDLIESEDRVSTYPGEGIYIHNAGLVLLHPYLSLFFQKLGLCRQGEFVNQTAREKAVHLLQYLAAKNTEVPEAEMVFNKVLCGFSLDEPIRKRVTLDESDKEEADRLLSVILNYWKALGTTSTDGLRANFLLRTGKLQYTSDGWKLIVERKPQDVLLEQLPWGVGVIKLPWMELKMFVEW
ncbi:contractile injection system tape measure protein [Flavilitoribacter nigricans]|uniref:Uncharacterized protein n=1 Tax=Flavilitoribacter nigricans (strain ATCC 23147 / DSM 23189 / NBRC 102662 / NCIMB 1420 / SS-2) TaxID=1122177 RepID=A0A2D0ND78_FLAN2|nr:contractile injection system tape measure protein [Flavilitoribacter nigricans]PHN06358.1 hypothetical protein CRP01_12370 [Flavilitoribacter nigricans DSM 23189 = NBRC 102662]